MAKFVPTTTSSYASVTHAGAPISSYDAPAVESWAAATGLPAGVPEPQLRMALCALTVAAGDGGAGSSTVVWKELREEARGLLLLGIRREGVVSAATAAALNVLNKPAVVEKYKTYGNKWTMAEAARDNVSRGRAEGQAEMEAVRKALGESSGQPVGEWLSSLAEVLEEPSSQRPWYLSKVVLIVLGVTTLFVGGHLLMLARVLQKVHTADPQILMYPLVGLGASGLVGGLAYGVNKLSDLGGPRKAAQA